MNEIHPLSFLKMTISISLEDFEEIYFKYYIFFFYLKLMCDRVKREDSKENILQFIQDIKFKILNTWIEEPMEFGLTRENSQASISSFPIPQKEKSNINKEAFNNEEFNNNKLKEVKEILIKSLVKPEKIVIIKDSDINYNSLDNVIKYLKICEHNILLLHKREIFYYVLMGKLIKNIKLKFPCNWINILKEKKIIYTNSHFNFLIQIFNLFDKYKILYRTTLNLLFFRKNFSIIKEIAKKEFI